MVFQSCQCNYFYSANGSWRKRSSESTIDSAAPRCASITGLVSMLSLAMAFLEVLQSSNYCANSFSVTICTKGIGATEAFAPSEETSADCARVSQTTSIQSYLPSNIFDPMPFPLQNGSEGIDKAARGCKRFGRNEKRIRIFEIRGCWLEGSCY